MGDAKELIHRVLINLHDANASQVAQQIDTALREWGFFFLENHGIDESLIRSMWMLTKKFHALPLERKQHMRPQLGAKFMGYFSNESSAQFENAFPESCSIAQTSNQWPDESIKELEDFRTTCVRYADAVDRLWKSLLSLLEEAMDLEAGTLSSTFKETQSYLNLRHDKPIMGFGKRLCGVKPHTDSGVLTFLPQQNKPGFEICLSNGEWMPIVIPKEMQREDSTIYLVQAGDCFRRWTNHRFVSALHRVVHQGENGDRYAMPLFWGPGEEFVMQTLPVGDEIARKNYVPVTYAEYMRGFAAAEEEGDVARHEFTTINSLTMAQRKAAKENRIEERVAIKI